MIECQDLIWKLTNHWVKEWEPTVYDFTSIIDTNCIIRYVSDNQQHITGWEPCEVIGKNLMEYVYPDGFPFVLRKLKESLFTKKPSEIEIRIRSKHEECLGIRATCIPIVSNDEMVGFIVWSRQINMSYCHN